MTGNRPKKAIIVGAGWVLPAGLAQAVTAILAGRDRRAPVLVNPGAPRSAPWWLGSPTGCRCPGRAGYGW